MLLHRNRQATPPEGKGALRSLSNDASHRRNLWLLRPPLQGRSQKPAELRPLLARSPATRLRRTPRQRISENDHDGQMGSNMGLGSRFELSGQIAKWGRK